MSVKSNKEETTQTPKKSRIKRENISELPPEKAKGVTGGKSNRHPSGRRRDAPSPWGG
jgi:hypothetical protein